MTDKRYKARWFWALFSPLLASLVGLHPAVARDAGGLRVTDYFISHTSNEPFYAQQSLNPHVTLHVREVVLAGRERTVAQDGKVLLLIHGFSIPGAVAFDTDRENCSLAGRSIESDLAEPKFDATKVTVPTLVIRGDADTDATREDNQQLMEALGSTVKEYVEIPGGGHFLHFEKVNIEFYQAVRNFLEAEE